VKKRRKPTYYEAFSLADGTILLACPVRKPSRRVLKDYRVEIDTDGVGFETLKNDWHTFREPDCEERRRRHDLIANRLNVRRAIRDLVLPELTALAERLSRLEQQITELKSVPAK
jgi:hypothetical protein